MIEQYLSARELAQKLSVSEDTVWKLAWNNELRSIKIGRRRVFPVSAIQEWLNGLEAK